MGSGVTAVHIDRLEDGVFYANLVFDDGTTVSARPSDAVAIALRTGTPTSFADEVFDKAGWKLQRLKKKTKSRPSENFWIRYRLEDFGGSARTRKQNGPSNGYIYSVLTPELGVECLSS